MDCVPDCGHPVPTVDMHTIVTCCFGACENSACGPCASGGRIEEWVGEGPLRRTRDDGSEEVLQGPVEIFGFDPFTFCGGAGCEARFCSSEDCYEVPCDGCGRFLCDECGPVLLCSQTSERGCDNASCQREECGGPFKSCVICGPLCSPCYDETWECCVCGEAWCSDHNGEGRLHSVAYCDGCGRIECGAHGVILCPCDSHEHCEREACGGRFPRCHACGSPRCGICHPPCSCCGNHFCDAHAVPCAVCAEACCDARCADMHPSIVGCAAAAAAAAAKRARVEGGGGGGGGGGAEGASAGAAGGGQGAPPALAADMPA